MFRGSHQTEIEDIDEEITRLRRVLASLERQMRVHQELKEQVEALTDYLGIKFVNIERHLHVHEVVNGKYTPSGDTSDTDSHQPDA